MLSRENRLDLYAALCSLFCYPEEELLEHLVTGQLADVLYILPDLPPPPEFDDSLDLAELQTAYTGLFINRLGGVPAPPYGSAYLDDNGLVGSSTQLVEQIYAEAGLAVEGSVEPADFLPTELEFMFRLIELEQSANERGDSEAESMFSNLQSRFVDKCLHPWIGEFSNRIQQTSQGHPLYTWSSHLLATFCEREHAQLKTSA